MTHKETASAVANTAAQSLVESGVPADDIADALIVKALAVWAADTGRCADAEALLMVWCMERDR